MAIYHVYKINSQGHSEKPPHVIECADIRDAVHAARQCVDGKAVEVWEGAKRLVRLEPEA